MRGASAEGRLVAFALQALEEAAAQAHHGEVRRTWGIDWPSRISLHETEAIILLAGRSNNSGEALDIPDHGSDGQSSTPR